MSTFRFDIAEHLETEEDIRGFLSEVAATGDEADFIHALSIMREWCSGFQVDKLKQAMPPLQIHPPYFFTSLFFQQHFGAPSPHITPARSFLFRIFSEKDPQLSCGPFLFVLYVLHRVQAIQKEVSHVNHTIIRRHRTET
jgi:hypothetical protein